MSSISFQTGAGWIAIFFFTALINVLYHNAGAKAGTMNMELRMLAPVEAISDGIDRCKEMGKPLYMTIGCYAQLSGQYAPMTISAINIQRYAARLAVRRDVEPWFMVPMIPEALPLIDGVDREVCIRKMAALAVIQPSWIDKVERMYAVTESTDIVRFADLT